MNSFSADRGVPLPALFGHPLCVLTFSVESKKRPPLLAAASERVFQRRCFCLRWVAGRRTLELRRVGGPHLADTWVLWLEVLRGFSCTHFSGSKCPSRPNREIGGARGSAQSQAPGGCGRACSHSSLGTPGGRVGLGEGECVTWVLWRVVWAASGGGQEQ